MWNGCVIHKNVISSLTKIEKPIASSMIVEFKNNEAQSKAADRDERLGKDSKLPHRNHISSILRLQASKY